MAFHENEPDGKDNKANLDQFKYADLEHYEVSNEQKFSNTFSHCILY